MAVRVIGPKNRYVGDNYAFAQSAPVYVVRDGITYTSAEDAEFLLQTVDAVWRRVDARDSWRSEEEKQVYRDAVERARTAYRRAIQNASR